jgi:hypothetical protein
MMMALKYSRNWNSAYNYFPKKQLMIAIQLNILSHNICFGVAASFFYQLFDIEITVNKLL